MSASNKQSKCEKLSIWVLNLGKQVVISPGFRGKNKESRIVLPDTTQEKPYKVRLLQLVQVSIENGQGAFRSSCWRQSNIQIWWNRIGLTEEYLIMNRSTDRGNYIGVNKLAKQLSLKGSTPWAGRKCYC